MSDRTDADVIVIGAGFGGLGCALSLAERGLRPRVFEALRYPGGCASTFTRDGYAFESGATLFTGLGEMGLFGRWIRAHRMPVETAWIDPLVELRTKAFRLSLTRERGAFIDELCARSPGKAEALRRFFTLQKRVSDALWSVLDAPELLPPFTASALARHVARLPSYAPLATLVGRPLSSVLARFGLAGLEPLDSFCRALCQITVQCSPEEAEAPLALSALDYGWRGTGHVVGGIGELAHAMVAAIRRLDGEVHLAERVREVRGEEGAFEVVTNRGRYTAPRVVANLLPADARALLGGGPPRTERGVMEGLDADVKKGWGAAMLYLVTRPPAGARPEPHHLELVGDTGAPFIEGNHVFVSVSGAQERNKAPEGLRTVTVSTHVRMEARAGYVEEVQARMRRTLESLAPEWMSGVSHVLPASPRTFERFTRRSGGYVGGVPRRVGIGQYLRLSPVEPVPGVWLVGDSVFPGQSILATAVGGVQVAAAITRRHSLPRSSRA